MLLSLIVTDLCDRAGIGAALIDVTELTDDVLGYQIPRQMPARTALETLMTAYNFDAVERDWKLYFRKRGSASVAAIAANELRVHRSGDQVPDKTIETRTQDLEIPTHFTLSYESKVRDYEIASQNAVRVDKATFLPKAAAIGLVMTDSHAKQQAEILLKQMWVNRHRYGFSTTNKYIKLAPGDVITVSGKIMRVIEMADRDGIIDFVCESEEGGVYTNSAVADDLTAGAIDLTAAAYIPLFVAMDIPAINEDFGNAGLTFAMYGNASYTGGGLQRSIDGTVYTDVWYFNSPSAVVGTCSTTLGSGIFGIIDYTNSITVDCAASLGTLASATDAQLWSGANLIAVGSTATGWELMQFKTATLVSGNNYTLTGLLRGQYATQRFMTTHAASETLVLLTDLTGTMHTGVDFIAAAIESIGIGYLYRAKNPSQAVGDGTAFVTGKRTLDPYPVQIVNASRAADNEIALSWYRGDRYEFITPDMPSTGDIAMEEVTQSYSVDVIHSGTSAVLRTIASTAPAITYTAAQQSSDSYPAAHPIIFDIYQVSAVTGRGIVTRASV
jgi:hypothetical protein